MGGGLRGGGAAGPVWFPMAFMGVLGGAGGLFKVLEGGYMSGEGVWRCP